MCGQPSTMDWVCRSSRKRPGCSSASPWSWRGVGRKGFGEADTPFEEEKDPSEMTGEASKSFERGDLSEAARRYREILNLFPDDPVARSLLRICSADDQAAEAVDSL